MFRLDKKEPSWQESCDAYYIDDLGHRTEFDCLYHHSFDIDLSSVPETLQAYIASRTRNGLAMRRITPEAIFMANYNSSTILTEAELPSGTVNISLGWGRSSGKLISKYLNPQSKQTAHLGERNKPMNTAKEMMCEECASIETCWLVNGDWLCANCLEALGYVQCEDCGEWIREKDAMDGPDFQHYCEDCFYRNFFICEDCGEAVPADEVCWVNGRYGQFAVCEYCRDNNYYQCMDCEEWFLESLTYRDSNDNHLCQNCYDNGWHTCCDCGEFIWEDNTYWDEDDDPYCSSCYEGNSGREHNYSYKPEPVTHKTDRDCNELYFGVENEVDNGNNKNDCISDIKSVRGEDYIYCKHDGSLNDGFEMVSHPMTLRYHMTEMPWQKIFGIALENGFRSHDTSTCGLHIHVGREQLGDSEEAQSKAVRKIVYLVNKHWDSITIFTRRRESRLQQWAARPEISEWVTDETSSETLDSDINAWYSATRYTAVNRCNYETIEFRIYRGTLNHTSFLAALQFTSNICRYAMTHSWEDCRCSTWTDIACFETYPELTAYLEKRGLAATTAAEPDEEISYDTADIAAVAVA